MFILRIPFEIQNGAQLNDPDKEIAHGNLHFKLKKEAHRYALIISGFHSEEEASLYFPKAWTGLSNVILNCGVAPKFKLNVENATVSSDPAKTGLNIAKSFGLPPLGDVHGVFDASDTIVFDDQKIYKSISGSNLNFIYGASSDRFLQCFKDGADIENALDKFSDDRLRVSIDMYASFYSESSENARFLSLIMSLESLAEQKPRPESVVNLIIQFQEMLLEKECATISGSEENLAFSALRREIDFRKGDSIRSQIRSLVSTTLQENGDRDHEEVARQALKVYDARSELVHNGKIKSGNLGVMTDQARNIVERVLRIKLTKRKKNDNV